MFLRLRYPVKPRGVVPENLFFDLIRKVAFEHARIGCTVTERVGGEDADADFFLSANAIIEIDVQQDQPAR